MEAFVRGSRGPAPLTGPLLGPENRPSSILHSLPFTRLQLPFVWARRSRPAPLCVRACRGLRRSKAASAGLLAEAKASEMNSPPLASCNSTPEPSLALRSAGRADAPQDAVGWLPSPGPQAHAFRSFHHASSSADSVKGLNTLSRDSLDSQGGISSGETALFPSPLLDGRQCNFAYLPAKESPISPLSFRQSLNHQRQPLEAPVSPDIAGAIEWRSDKPRRNELPAAQKTTLRPCRVPPPECTPDAVSAPRTGRAEHRMPEAAREPVKKGLALHGNATDRLSQVEHILEKLIHEAKVLRFENMKLRAAKRDLSTVSCGGQHNADEGEERDLTARLKNEVALLKRRLKEQDELLRALRSEAAYVAACREPGCKLMLPCEGAGEDVPGVGDEGSLRALLLDKQEALKRSRIEISSLRSELALLRSSEDLKTSELEELRTRCKDLRGELIEKHKELRSCPSATVALGAEAVAAKGARVSKAWEFEQMEERLQHQLDQQVEGRLALAADKQEATEKVERLQAALRAVTERSHCQAELLQDRDEEVQLLEQRVARLCRQRERDASKLKEQNATLIRWRTYILFLEKLIRDLRVYITSQAEASSAGSLRASSKPSHRASYARGQLQDKSLSTKGHASLARESQQKPREALAAGGYTLLPRSLSCYEPSFHQPPCGWPGSPSKSPQNYQPSRNFAAPRVEESESVEQLGRLMHEAAEQLRATAAVARRGQSPPARTGRRGPCGSRPPAGGGSSPGSTEASSIGDTGRSVPYAPCGPDAAGPGLLSEYSESLDGYGLVSPSAYAIISGRPPGSAQGTSLPYEDVVGCMTDAGSSPSNLSIFEASRKRNGSCARWLNKGAAAAHLAKEIASRFPSAYDRLQKTSPSCKLINKI
ncbi:hypothetical protein Emag_003985 [Eimeria magna]